MPKPRPVAPRPGGRGNIRGPSLNPKEPDKLSYPSFSFLYTKTKKYRVEDCEKHDKISLLKKLRILSQITWKEIAGGAKHALGYELIPQSDLNVSLPSHITPDTPILALRFSGKKPMLGYKEGAVFYILLIDKDFSAYNHGR